MLHDDTPDTGCGLKLFPRALFLDLPYFDHMHRFLPALVLREGGIVRSVPVNHRPRQRGTSKYGVFDRLGVGIADLVRRHVAAPAQRPAACGRGWADRGRHSARRPERQAAPAQREPVRVTARRQSVRRRLLLLACAGGRRSRGVALARAVRPARP